MKLSRVTAMASTLSLSLIVALVLAASMLARGTAAFAQQPKPGQPSNAPQLSAADEKAIRDILKDQEMAWNAHDMKAFTKSFREDAEGVNVVGMDWRGKEAILAHLTAFHQTLFKDLEEKLAEVNVHSIGDGYAIAVSIWEVGAFKAPNGVEIPAGRHRSTLVLAKGTDGWQVVHFHNTTIDEAALKAAAAAEAASK